MATFSLKSRSLFARNCILATNKQFTKSPLQQAAARWRKILKTWKKDESLEDTLEFIQGNTKFSGLFLIFDFNGGEINLKNVLIRQ